MPRDESTGRRGGTRTAEAAVAVVSLLVALAGAEVFLRVSDHFRPPSNPPQCGYWDPDICAMYAPAEGYGYALQPSVRTEYLYPEDDPRKITVVSNRHGFRDSRELDEPDGRPRVIVLGDSFVFGEGVEEGERFTNVLEDLSGRRVDSLGMTGWGPDLMLRALEEPGVGLHPDAVLLCLYTHDFRRVHPLYAGIGFRIPRYELRDGRLVTVPYPPPSLWQKSRLLWALSPARRSYDEGMWDVHAAILDRFRELSRDHGFALGLVFLPGRADLEPDRERRGWLSDYASRNGVPLLDLTEPVLERPRQELFIHGGNPHWNADGHRFVAGLLAPFVDERLMGSGD